MKDVKKNILYLVIPCYNEEEVLPITTKKLTEKLDNMIKDKLVSKESRIMYVNDGSKDRTWELIGQFNKTNKYVIGVNLSRNRGHQNALLAGLMTAKEYADIVVSMDADLQDDIDVVDKMVIEYNNGCDIVYGVRSARKTDTWFKKTTAEGFYKFMALLGVEIVYNHADYRLMSKRALNELENFKEVNLFLRGIIPLLGFKTAKVEYERKERFAGESKYPLKKMLNFALDGILSFSIKPIRIITSAGFIVSFLSFLFLIYVIIGHFVSDNVTGWTTIVALICFFGSFQVLCIGIIGEYIGKIYNETKHRPRYIIEDVLLKEGK
jgi:glycosyltransferase involved in cell wall biosynthesis